MSRQKELVEIRNLLVEKSHQLGAKGATSQETVDAVRQENPDAVKRASRVLENIAMLRLLSQTRDTRGSSITPLQISFLDALKLPPQVGVDLEDGTHVFKNIEDADLIKEIEVYSKKLSKPSRKSRRKTDLDILVEHYKPFYGDNCRTLNECMKAEERKIKKG